MKKVTEMTMKELDGTLKELTMQTVQCCDIPIIHAIEDEIEYRREGGKRNETYYHIDNGLCLRCTTSPIVIDGELYEEIFVSNLDEQDALNFQANPKEYLEKVCGYPYANDVEGLHEPYKNLADVLNYDAENIPYPESGG